MLAEQFRQSIAIEQGIIDIDSLDININTSQDDIELEIDTIVSAEPDCHPVAELVCH
jgi:hypothetical protein